MKRILSLSVIETLDKAAFVGALGFAFEDSPWVIERAFDARPFADPTDMANAAAAVLARATNEERLALIRAHPQLADKVAMGDHSRAEQSGAGLDSLSPEALERFQVLNGAYAARFDFPFVICVRLNDKASILDAMARRLENSQAKEINEAIAQIVLIAGFRLADAFAP